MGTYSRSCFLADARFALHGFPAAVASERASERASESDRRDGALDALDEDLFGFFVAFFFPFFFPPSPLFSACGLEDGSCSGLGRSGGLEDGRGSRTGGRG